MAAAASYDLLCVPEDATPLQARVQELEARVRVMTPLLTILLEEKIEKENTLLSSLKSRHLVTQTFHILVEGIRASTTLEEAIVSYKAAVTTLTPSGYTFPTPPTAFASPHGPVDVLHAAVCTAGQYQIGGYVDIYSNPEGFAKTCALFKKDFDEAKARYEKQQALVDSLQAQHAVLNADALREEEIRRKEEEARRKEAARRELQAKIAAMQAELAAL
jgi:hypothetical protein